MKALHHTQGSQRRIAKAFHKKVKIRHVQQGDLVLKENRAPPHDPRGKFKPNWGEPYVVKEVFPGKAIKLTDLDGNDFGVELQNCFRCQEFLLKSSPLHPTMRPFRNAMNQTCFLLCFDTRECSS